MFESFWEFGKSIFLSGLIVAVPIYGYVGVLVTVFWGCKMLVFRGENDIYDWLALSGGFMLLVIFLLIKTMVVMGII